MYIFWLTLSVLMLLARLYYEWQISRAFIKTLHPKLEDAILPGRKNTFLLIQFCLSFIGISALYFSITDFVHMETDLVCWLLPALLVGSINVLGTLPRLKYLEFEE
jgi:hypothetical protein